MKGALINRRWLAAVASGLALTTAALVPGAASASAIGAGDFGAGALVEGFEGLSHPYGPGLGIPYMLPGQSGPFAFSSGMTMVEPVPNGGLAAAYIADFAWGNATFGLGANGQVTGPADLPGGTAYMALNGYDMSVSFTLGGTVSKVGAFVTGTGGDPITLSAFDSGGGLLDSQMIAPVSVGDWPSTFLGLQAEGIAKITLSGDFLAIDNIMAEDGELTDIPEPLSLALLGGGLLGLGVLRRRRDAA